jgi:hypothetical protein
MPAKAFSDLHGRDVRTVKQCPPFVDAMTYGFMIPLPCDVTVSNGAFSWDWDIPTPAAHQHPRAPLSFHVQEQLAGSALSNVDGRAAIKFNSFWTIELEEGWSIFATHPLNRDDLPFRTVSGIVDSDRFYHAGINFPAIWTKPNFDGVLPKGLPVAQCFPVRREPFELIVESFDERHVESYDSTVSEVLKGSGIYRKKFRHGRASFVGNKSL